MSRLVKIVFTVPESHADLVRKAIGEAGAGKIGNYTFRSISSKVTGRFLANEKAHPTIGTIEQIECIAEVRIEVQCERTVLPIVLKALKNSHPYEEIALDIFALEEIPLV